MKIRNLLAVLAALVIVGGIYVFAVSRPDDARGAITVYHGCFATVNISLCVGCGLCEKVCPANAVLIRDRKDEKLGMECSLEDKETGACPMCSALATSLPYTPEIPLPSRRKKQ